MLKNIYMSALVTVEKSTKGIDGDRLLVAFYYVPTLQWYEFREENQCRYEDIARMLDCRNDGK